ncbi:MAG: hypothetical protein WB752_05080, partial [Pseudolabrys sp.]
GPNSAAPAAESPFRFGNGEHAARGIKAREAGAGATGARADAVGDRLPHLLTFPLLPLELLVL